MKFVVAGGGVVGLAASLALARAGQNVIVLERDRVDADGSPRRAFDVERRGIPHYFQPHAFLPRGRRLLLDWAPDVLDALMDAGADPQDVALKLQGPRQPGDEDLVYLWVRRPVIEWALRRAAAAEPAVEIRAGVRVTALLTSENEAPRATGVALDKGDPVRGDVVVDALGRYRCPSGWPRATGQPSDSGAIYYCRYFVLAEGVEHLDAPILNPRGDLGYMGFNTFRGDNRKFAVILLAPTADRELRVLRHEQAWQAACSAITPLDVMTSEHYARPITDVMPMGGLMNVDRTSDPPVSGIVAVGDAFCHTDPAFAYGLSFSLAHAQALANATDEAPDVDAIAERYRAQAGPEAPAHPTSHRPTRPHLHLRRGPRPARPNRDHPQPAHGTLAAVTRPAPRGTAGPPGSGSTARRSPSLVPGDGRGRLALAVRASRRDPTLAIAITRKRQRSTRGWRRGVRAGALGLGSAHVASGCFCAG
jgi:2-polyprenyl-6-methoxyphenol hydroxylase-like FAD-dependent oxidoreductase